MATNVDSVRRRQTIESINQRLDLLDSVAHQVALIEEMNHRLVILEERLQRNFVDPVSMEAVVAELRLVATTTADRLEATERRLNELSKHLARPD